MGDRTQFKNMVLSECPCCRVRQGETHISSCPVPHHVSLSEAVHWLTRTVEQYHDVASYLADCHAATLEHEGALKSCSQSTRDRYLSICQRALAYLEGKDAPQSRGLVSREQNLERVKDRLRKAIEHRLSIRVSHS